MTTTNPAPEPGQRYLIEAEGVIEIETGSVFFRLTDSAGDRTGGLWPDTVVWHPADVPPQPPVLANGTPVVLAGSGTPYVISAIENHCDGPDCRQMTVRLWTHHSDAEKLADVPGPDDTTPTPDVCPDCGGSGVEEWDGTGYPRCMGCGGSGADESEPQPHEGEQL